MTSAYLFAMLAVTPSKSREVALIANPEFEAGRVAGHRARRLIDGGNPAFSDPFLVMAEDWAPRSVLQLSRDELKDRAGQFRQTDFVFFDRRNQFLDLRCGFRRSRPRIPIGSRPPIPI